MTKLKSVFWSSRKPEFGSQHLMLGSSQPSTCNSSFKGSDTLLISVGTHTHVAYTHRHMNTRINKNKSRLLKTLNWEGEHIEEGWRKGVRRVRM